MALGVYEELIAQDYCTTIPPAMARTFDSETRLAETQVTNHMYETKVRRKLRVSHR